MRDRVDERVDRLAIRDHRDRQSGVAGIARRAGTDRREQRVIGDLGNCSRTCSATEPLVMRIALMRPFSTSRLMRSVTGTPTVRYATTLSTS